MGPEAMSLSAKLLQGLVLCKSVRFMGLRIRLLRYILAINRYLL